MNKNKRKLNFLLVMPRLVQNVGDGYVFPLGIAYISSSLKKAGFNVFTLNLNHHEGDVFDIIGNNIKEHHINVVATGGLSPQYHLIKSVIESAKQINSNTITVVGGGIISAEPELAMEALEFVDFGVIGEGEVTMCELAEALENNGDLSDVEGLVLKRKTEYIKTKKRKDIENIDTIPWPDYEGFDIEKYLDVPSAGFAGLNKKRMICMLGSRSCPFNCTFCFHTNGKRYRKRSLDDFFAELDYLISKYNIEYISMADELFAPTFKEGKEFCDRIKSYNIHWYADFRIDKVSAELLPVLKGSGLDVMFFGLESADNRILKSMRKGITVEQIETSLKSVYEAGIAIYGCFIFGDLEETIETANNTLKWWHEHSKYFIHLTLVKPFPGSFIYKHACKSGIIKDPVKYLKDGCPQINISKMSDMEFAGIMHKISEAADSSNALREVELLDVDPVMGRETISGICSKCSKKSIWENVKLFAIDYIYCSHCSQKYEIPCPQKLRDNIDKNISLLLREYGKIAVWGMTLSIMNLFKTSEILRAHGVFPIDISDSKRMMELNGKRIYAPSVLNEENIKVVVIAVPSHAGQISCQIKENHSQATQIVDICHLVDFNPVATC